MDIVRCLSCGQNVLPGADFTCPSCGNDVREDHAPEVVAKTKQQRQAKAGNLVLGLGFVCSLAAAAASRTVDEPAIRIGLLVLTGLVIATGVILKLMRR